jgi:hypothetical protein
MPQRSTEKAAQASQWPNRFVDFGLKGNFSPVQDVALRKVNPRIQLIASGERVGVQYVPPKNEPILTRGPVHTDRSLATQIMFADRAEHCTLTAHVDFIRGPVG